MTISQNFISRIIITSPSINTADNISGISNFTKLLIESNHDFKYIHFKRGKKDYQKRRIVWLLKQSKIIFNFLKTLIINKDIGIVHINMPLEKYAILRDTIFVLMSACFRKKIIVHFHGGKYNMNEKTPFYLKIFIKLTILLSNQIITLSSSEKKFLVAFYKVDSTQIINLYNAVKLENSLEPKSFNIIPTILYLGRIDKNKGLREIILSLKLLNDKLDFKFIIAGDGPEKNNFINECKKQFPDKYEYLGVISGGLKQRVLNKSNIFLMPSYYEGLPYALLEAMSYGLIPIVTPVGAIPEIIEDRINGLIVPIHDYKIIAQRIIEVINNPRRMQEISENAYNSIKINFSLNDYITNLNKIYSRLIAIHE